MSRRKFIVALILLLTYVGPYVYTYWRAEYSVFPTAVVLDNNAINNLQVYVGNVVTEKPARNFEYVTGNSSWTAAIYSVPYGILNRIFLNYRNVQVLLDITKLRFSAQGVFNGTVILQCDSYQDRLAIPTGAEFLPIYKSILFANNNTVATSLCIGPGPPLVDFAKLSAPYQGVLPITLNWSISATVTGEEITTPQTWRGIIQATIVFP